MNRYQLELSDWSEKKQQAFLDVCGRFVVRTTAPLGEVEEVIDNWASETGWIPYDAKNSFLNGLAYEWETLEGRTVGVKDIVSIYTFKLAKSLFDGYQRECNLISILMTSHGKGIDIEFFASLTKPSAALHQYQKTDNEASAHRFAHAVCYELSQRGYQVKPHEFADDPQLNATKIGKVLRLANLGTFLCIIFMFASFIAIPSATESIFGIVSVFVGLSVALFFATLIPLTMLLRLRTQGMKGRILIVATVLIAVVFFVVCFITYAGLVYESKKLGV